MPLTCSDMDHTVLPAKNTIYVFTRKHSPGGIITHIRIANAWVQLTTHLSTPRGWMAELAMLADSLPWGGHLRVRRRDQLRAQRLVMSMWWCVIDRYLIVTRWSYLLMWKEQFLYHNTCLRHTPCWTVMMMRMMLRLLLVRSFTVNEWRQVSLSQKS